MLSFSVAAATAAAVIIAPVIDCGEAVVAVAVATAVLVVGDGVAIVGAGAGSIVGSAVASLAAGCGDDACGGDEGCDDEADADRLVDLAMLDEDRWTAGRQMPTCGRYS